VGTPEPLTRPANGGRARALLVAMLVSVAAVGSIADWDSNRESTRSIDDFARAQETLASSVAAALETRLALARARSEGSLAAPALLAGLTRVEEPGSSRLLLAAPGSGAWVDARGQSLSAPQLLSALEQGARSLRVERPQALALGLPERLAIAGLARADDGAGGHYGVALIATAYRERDRQRRASWRLLLSVLLAAALVLAFGGVALRIQRRELRLQQELALAELGRQRDERLERLDKAATMLTMASGVAHEICTPLSVITGRAEQLLERARGDEKLERSARAILGQAQNINDVVRGFLDLARGGTPALQQLEIRQVVASALELVEHRFGEAGVQLVAHVEEPLPPVAGEPRLLEHALVNLLLNACDACARGGGRVELRAQRTQASIELCVLDNGSGILPADAARVTEPFFTTKPAGKGTGLGLAVVSEIAKSHRGSLVLTPATPRGTRASLILPLSIGDAHD